MICHMADRGSRLQALPESAMLFRPSILKADRKPGNDAHVSLQARMVAATAANYGDLPRLWQQSASDLGEGLQLPLD